MRYKKKYKIHKKYSGGGIQPLGNYNLSGNKINMQGSLNPSFAPIAGMVGTSVNALSQQKDGSVNTGGAILGGAASGAAAGAIAGPWGAVIGGAIGGITSGITASKKNKEISKQKKIDVEMGRRHKNNVSRMLLSTYPSQGVEGTTRYYSYGGINHTSIDGTVPPMVSIPVAVAPHVGQSLSPTRNFQAKVKAEGGAIVPIASNAARADGATHKEGGINVGNGVEVEDDEVQVNMGNYDVWFSNKLKSETGKTFANTANKIMKAKGKNEKFLKSASKATQNTAKRNIEKADMEITELANEQLQVQTKKGINPMGQTVAENGAIYNNTVQMLPYLDNVTNAILTTKTPHVPQPELFTAANLQTNYNINPQLDEVRRGFRNTAEGLRKSTSNATVLRNNMIAASIASNQATNQLYGQKENIETDRKNQDALNKQQVNNQNTQQINNYQTLKTKRIDDIHQRISANAANLSEDAMYQVKENRLADRDKQVVELLKQKYKDSGVMERNYTPHLSAYIRGDISWEEYKLKENMIKGKKRGTPDKVPTLPTQPITNNDVPVLRVGGTLWHYPY